MGREFLLPWACQLNMHLGKVLVRQEEKISLRSGVQIVQMKPRVNLAS